MTKIDYSYIAKETNELRWNLRGIACGTHGKAIREVRRELKKLIKRAAALDNAIRPTAGTPRRRNF